MSYILKIISVNGAEFSLEVTSKEDLKELKDKFQSIDLSKKTWLYINDNTLIAVDKIVAVLVNEIPDKMEGE